MTGTIISVRERRTIEGRIRFEVEAVIADKPWLFEGYTFDVGDGSYLQKAMRYAYTVKLTTQDTRYGVQILNVEAA